MYVTGLEEVAAANCENDLEVMVDKTLEMSSPSEVALRVSRQAPLV